MWQMCVRTPQFRILLDGRFTRKAYWHIDGFQGWNNQASAGTATDRLIIFKAMFS
jgi:hypothetical protein